MSTEHHPVFDRREWLREMNRSQFAKVEIIPPTNNILFNETTIYDWDKL